MEYSLTIGIKTILKHISYALAFIIGTVGMSPDSFAILGILMLVDTITGVLRVGRTRGWRAVQSSKLSAGILSKAVVITVPVLIAWAGKGAGIDLTQIAEATLSVLILAELYSTLGNIYGIHTGKEVKEFDAVAFILQRVRDLIEKVLKDNSKI